MREFEIPKDITKITEVGAWTKEGWKSQELDIPLFANSYRKNIMNYLLRIIERLYLSA